MLTSAPPAARIEQIDAKVLPCHADEIGFRITDSQPDQDGRALVTADLAICEACLAEM
jgi:hydrogenase maturation factor HypF (carbamoyltransferase family)